MRCKFCSATLPNDAMLRRHVAAEHPDQFRRVSAWLAEVDSKLEHLDRVAQEGMLGYKA